MIYSFICLINLGVWTPIVLRKITRLNFTYFLLFIIHRYLPNSKDHEIYQKYVCFLCTFNFFWLYNFYRNIIIPDSVGAMSWAFFDYASHNFQDDWWLRVLFEGQNPNAVRFLHFAAPLGLYKNDILHRNDCTKRYHIIWSLV